MTHHSQTDVLFKRKEEKKCKSHVLLKYIQNCDGFSVGLGFCGFLSFMRREMHSACLLDFSDFVYKKTPEGTFHQKQQSSWNYYYYISTLYVFFS